MEAMPHLSDGKCGFGRGRDLFKAMGESCRVYLPPSLQLVYELINPTSRVHKVSPQELYFASYCPFKMYSMGEAHPRPCLTLRRPRDFAGHSGNESDLVTLSHQTRCPFSN